MTTTANPLCQLCGQPGRVLHETLRDRLGGSPGTWTLKHCPGCALAWLDPRPTGADLTLAYANYYTHNAAPDVPTPVRRLYRRLRDATALGRERRRLNLMCLDQTPPGKLLDIGCGNGQRLVQFRARGWDVAGQEVDAAAAQLARTQFQLPVHLGPVETLTGEYNAIIMNHVIEHVPDPVATLRECYRLLRTGGQLVAITPNLASYGHARFGAKWRELDPPRHLHLFTPASLGRGASLAGFDAPVTWTSSARAVGMALGSGVTSRPAALWFQIIAFRRCQQDRAIGEECVLQATK